VFIVSLPVQSAGQPIHSRVILGDNLSNTYLGESYPGADNLTLYAYGVNTATHGYSTFDGTWPFTWGTGDFIEYHGTYEMA
jgi:hypothetical protein